ncbi:hypothetical protein [Flavihumibacter sp. CACIAM 22H1]|uniref:hypothetical protein n=1 Tax=Flavihumibacter sp. CACIAM 22H1 TaxID=1812911 RepID=UPI0007A80E55|nr:hypothetical protein [Flavihumibacter sp. CACIAM 22H1]KYP14304.1 MAG: hypothetical protein A1D16_02165 [Flavihumibacter sp. CACIAM 22H1]
MRVYMSCFLLLTLTFISGCKSGSRTSASGPLIGKLVISEICNHFVVAVESGKIDPAKLTGHFRDEKRAAEFTRVFTVVNSCSFAQAGIKEGDRFYFETTPARINQDCMVCMAYYPTPAASLSIINIKKINP